MTRLGGRFVVKEHLEQAGLGAEYVREAFLLVSCVSLHHGLFTVGADHVHRLTSKRTDYTDYFVCFYELD